MLLVVSVAGYHYTTGPGLPAIPVHVPSRSFTVPEKAPNKIGPSPFESAY